MGKDSDSSAARARVASGRVETSGDEDDEMVRSSRTRARDGRPRGGGGRDRRMRARERRDTDDGGFKRANERRRER
jgi:hypothetical protein